MNPKTTPVNRPIKDQPQVCEAPPLPVLSLNNIYDSITGLENLISRHKTRLSFLVKIQPEENSKDNAVRPSSSSEFDSKVVNILNYLEAMKDDFQKFSEFLDI